MDVSAEIIPFRRVAGRSPAPDRLAMALSRLGAALADQKAAVAAWRGALADLAGQVRLTEASLLTHQTRLGELRTGVTLLRDQALALGKAVGNAG